MILPKMSRKKEEDKADRSHEEDNIQTNSLYGEVH